MNKLGVPQSDSPAALFDWARQLVRDLEAQQGGGGTVDSGSGDAPGTVKSWAGNTAPPGYVGLLGQLLSVVEYPALYRVVGRKWSNDDDPLDMFRLVDGTNRTFIGGDGSVGGTAELQIEIEHLPNVELSVTDPGHDHAFTGAPHSHAVSDPGHGHAIPGSPLLGGSTVGVGSGGTSVPVGAPGTLLASTAQTGVTVQNTTATGTIGSKQTGISVALHGGGESLPITPLFFSGLWIIKA